MGCRRTFVCLGLGCFYARTTLLMSGRLGILLAVLGAVSPPLWMRLHASWIVRQMNRIREERDFHHSRSRRQFLRASMTSAVMLVRPSSALIPRRHLKAGRVQAAE